jgi:hypothetical protein
MLKPCSLAPAKKPLKNFSHAAARSNGSSIILIPKGASCYVVGARTGSSHRTAPAREKFIGDEGRRLETSRLLVSRINSRSTFCRDYGAMRAGRAIATHLMRAGMKSENVPLGQAGDAAQRDRT